MSDKDADKSESDWKEELTPEQYYVCRLGGTEPPFSGRHVHEKREGLYRCAACGQALFASGTKFESGSGWPSYFAPIDEERVRERDDESHGMVRTEILCSRCGSHLGHVFPDGPPPTGLRYCVNSLALEFEPAEEED